LSYPRYLDNQLFLTSAIPNSSLLLPLLGQPGLDFVGDPQAIGEKSISQIPATVATHAASASR
jgi:hypothetical protein